MNRPGENKPPLSFNLTYAIEEARVWQRGAEKHGKDDWRREDIDPQQYVDAALRHIEAIDRGELVDPESGLPHAAHLAVDAKIFGVKTAEQAAAQAGAVDWSHLATHEQVRLRDIVGGNS